MSGPCECYVVRGGECDATEATVTIEWMPAHHRAAHKTAGNRGVYPHNGAVRLLCNELCADAIFKAEGEWARYIDSVRGSSRVTEADAEVELDAELTIDRATGEEHGR